MPQCTLPLTGYKVVEMIITEKCVFKVDKREGLTLIEIADGVEMSDLVATTGCEFKVNEKYIFFCFLYLFLSFFY